MAENDVDFFILDGITPSDPEPNPNPVLSGTTVSSFPSLNTVVINQNQNQNPLNSLPQRFNPEIQISYLKASAVSPNYVQEPNGLQNYQQYLNNTPQTQNHQQPLMGSQNYHQPPNMLQNYQQPSNISVNYQQAQTTSLNYQHIQTTPLNYQQNVNRPQQPQHHQSITQPLNHHQSAIKPSSNYQITLNRPTQNQHLPQMSPFFIRKSIQSAIAQEKNKPTNSVFCSDGLMESGASYSPTVDTTAYDISNGDGDNDFSFLSAIPCKIDEITPKGNSWSPSPSRQNLVENDEVFCSTGIVSTPSSNSGGNENGVEEDEEMMSPPINFVNVESFENSSDLNAAVGRSQHASIPNNNEKRPLKIPNTINNSQNSEILRTTLLAKNVNDLPKMHSTINPNDFVLINTPNSSNEFRLVRKLNLPPPEANKSLPHQKEVQKIIPITFGRDKDHHEVISISMTRHSQDKSEETTSKQDQILMSKPSQVTIKAVTKKDRSSVSKPSQATVNTCTVVRINSSKELSNDNMQNKGTTATKTDGKPDSKMLSNLRVVLTSLDLDEGKKNPVTKSLTEEKKKSESVNHVEISESALTNQKVVDVGKSNDSALKKTVGKPSNSKSLDPVISDQNVLKVGKSNDSSIKRNVGRPTNSKVSNDKKLSLNNSRNEIKIKTNNLTKVPEKTKISESCKRTIGKLEAESRNCLKKLRKEEKKSSKKAESDVKIVQDSREKNKNLVAHTVEDSDSDVCIIDEEIKNPETLKRKRGRPMKQLSLLKRLQASKKCVKCSECNFKTTSLSELKTHEATHPKGRKIKCSKCDFETRLKSCMIYHAAMHSGGKKFRCSKCSFKTDILENFLAHEAKKVFCPKCKTDCHTQKELNKHVFEAHGVGKFVCDKCNFTTRDVESMKSHTHKEDERAESPTQHKIKKLRGSENKAEKYVCTECYYTAPTIVLLREHIKSLHASDGTVKIKHKKKRGRKPLDKTNKSSTVKKVDDLAKYQTKYGEYLCPKCRFVSDERLYFENHLKTHSNEDDSMFTKPVEIFKCSFCEFETEFEKMIESHLLTHTEHDSDFDVEDEAQKKDDNLLEDEINFLEFIENKKYQCSMCEFQTDFESAFKRHKSLHVRKDVFNIIFSSLF